MDDSDLLKLMGPPMPTEPDDSDDDAEHDDPTEQDLILPNCELRRIDQKPTGNHSWKYVPMFKQRVNGAMDVWQIGFDYGETKLVIRGGCSLTSKGKPGKIKAEQYHEIVPKVKRTLQEQAVLEASRRYINKQKEGYAPANEPLPNDLAFCEPMLANKYRPPINLRPPGDNTKIKSANIKTFPVATMPKLDGIRCLFRLDNFSDPDSINLRSRGNNPFAWLEHIKAELKNYFAYLPPHTEIDGELYSQEMVFEMLTSAVTTKKRKHDLNQDVKYYIFDLIEAERMSWENRYSLMVGALNRYIEDHGEPTTFTIVQSYQANSHEEILQQHDFFVANRFEGIMIRQYASVMGIEASRYRSSRSNNLMKYKLFIDEECTVVGGVECVGNEVGAIKFLVRDPRGNELYIRPSGRIEKRIEWWDKYKVNPSKFVGKLYTIRYQQLSSDNIPRFPTGVGFRKDL